MKYNLLLIVPPSVSPDELWQKNKEKFSIKIKKEIPLGVLSIATYLQKRINDINVKIIDFNLIFSDMIEEGILLEKDVDTRIEEIIREQEEDFCFIGISAIFSAAFSYIKIISRICKKHFTDPFVFTGGGVPSNQYNEVFIDAQYIDAISYGEGEIPIYEIIVSEDRDKYLEETKYWITRENVKNNVKYEYCYIENLDDIPPLNFELISFMEYNNHVHNQDDIASIAAPLMFSRGCPFHCCFCASHSIHGRKIRYNSMERIITDVKYMVQKYGINVITIWDDNFFVNKEQAFMLLDFFISINIKIEFVNGFPVYRMDDEMACKLKEAGVDVVTLAIESGNDRVLKEIIHKPLKVSMVEKAITCLRKHDMYIKGLFVIGFPGETLEEIQMTMDFIHQTPLNWVDIFIASPIAGSELYDICNENGYLKQDTIGSCNYWKGCIETDDFTVEDIQKIQVYNVLKKDFVNNYDMQHGNYKRALVNFEYVIKAKHENPFAYYYASIAADKLEMKDKKLEYKNKFIKILKEDDEWKRYFKEFNLEIINSGGKVIC